MKMTMRTLTLQSRAFVESVLRFLYLFKVTCYFFLSWST